MVWFKTIIPRFMNEKNLSKKKYKDLEIDLEF